MAQGKCLDLVSLLSSENRNFLVRSNGDQVNVNDLCGKTVGLYFSGLWCPPCRGFNPELCKFYEALVSSKVDFEIVFVSSDHQDEEAFARHFSDMPWLAVPISDSRAIKGLKENFDVRVIPHLIILDGFGNVLTIQGVRYVREYGVEAFPFTRERIKRLKEEEKLAKQNQTLCSLLLSALQEYLISNDDKKIPLSEIEGKMIGLYFTVTSYVSCIEFSKKLEDVYGTLKRNGENFEIVMVYWFWDEDCEDDETTTREEFATMPWLALPFDCEACQDLSQHFEVDDVPKLVIIGPDGKTLNPDATQLINKYGVQAYPFTTDNLAELGKSGIKQAERYDDLLVRDSESEIVKKISDTSELHDWLMIVVMKGDPYTGKTTCANAISKSFKCSIIRFNDILDTLSTSVSSATTISTDEAERLADQAFDVIIQLVKFQISILRPVVIDCSLTHRRHLDQLLKLQTEPNCEELLLVIVECKPENKYAWQMRFNKRDPASEDQNKWFKPKRWQDVIDVSQSFEEGFYNDLPDHVSRLIVDTTDYVNPDNLGPATMDLIGCAKGHVLNYRDWLPTNTVHRNFAFLKVSPPSPPDNQGEEQMTCTLISCGRYGQHFLEETFDTSSLGSYTCRACQSPFSVPESAYACKNCQLSLHKSCSELEDKRMIPPQQLPSFLRRSPSSDYSIPNNYRFKCSSCEEAGREFSMDCDSCLWEAHLRSGIVPTILHESGGGYTVCFWITSTEHFRRYQCAACRHPGEFVGYTILEDTFGYNLHVECALLPNPVVHEHGGYKHPMKLVYSDEEDAEDYLCDVCPELRDPQSWFYYCEKCKFVSHTYCMTFSDDQEA